MDGVRAGVFRGFENPVGPPEALARGGADMPSSAIFTCTADRPWHSRAVRMTAGDFARLAMHHGGPFFFRSVAGACGSQAGAAPSGGA